MFLEPLGFRSAYSIVVSPRTAARQGLETITDLQAAAPVLRLGVTDTFARRPLDGLQPFLDRFGMRFEGVEVVPIDERAKLYDALVEERIAVLVGFSTDPEIRDYGLTTLEPDLPFFPAYKAAPLVSAAALAREPRIRETLEGLAGRLDDTLMSQLNRQVQIFGQRPRDVALRALAELELIEGTGATAKVPLYLSIDPEEVGGRMATAALRAVRQAIPGRDVKFATAAAPVQQVEERAARLALAPAIAQFDVSGGPVVRKETLETVAALGSAFVHALAREEGPATIGEARVIAAGPAGTPAHKLAEVVVRRLDPAPTILEMGEMSAQSAVAAVSDGKADVAIVIAEPGRRDLVEALRNGEGGLTLIESASWWGDAARLALPFLREATIPAGTYDRPRRSVATLAMQATLVGPAPAEYSVLGRQGPSSYTEDLYPLTDAVVLAINESLRTNPDVDPHLRKAAALTAPTGHRTQALNPHPDRSLLSLGIFLFLLWAGWLLVRPPSRNRSS